MARDLFANNASTTVSSGGTTNPASGTSESWTVAASTGFPASATGVSQCTVVDPAAPTELILVTNVSGTTWTVTRGSEGTTPVAHASGFTIRGAILTAAILAALRDGVSGRVPDSGGSIQPSHYVTGTAGAYTAGSAGFTPIEIGPGGMTLAGFEVNVTTAQSGGSMTYYLAVYADAGTKAAPLLTGGPLASVSTLDATTTGQKYVALGTAVYLQPGLYHLMFLAVQTTAPTTVAQFTVISSCTTLPGNASGVGNVYRQRVLASQTAPPTTGTPTPATTTPVLIAARRS